MKTTLTVLLIMELYGPTSCLLKKHFFVDQQMTWYKALNHCQTYFHGLSTLTKVIEEHNFLEDAAGQTSDAWTGLYIGSGTWMWLEEAQAATGISWDIGEPGNNACAFLHKDHKKLHDGNCQNQLPFYCMTLSNLILLPKNQTWEEALTYCRYHYTDLASLSSNNMMDSALWKVTGSQTEYVWTGLRFLAGEWFWVSGDDMDYTAWFQGQNQCPASNLQCGALDKNRKIWINRDCEEKLNLFCI